MKIKKGQQKLTRKQIEYLKEFARKQIKRYLTPKQYEEDSQLELYVNNAYKVAGLSLPKEIRIFDSPEKLIKYWPSVRDSVRDSVGASVRDSVWASVWDSVWASVRDSVWASVWDSVWASVWDSVWASVWASVRASVWDSVWASVWDSVWASVWDSVRDSVGAFYDSDTLSFYKVFHESLTPNNLVWLQKLSENVTGYAFYEKECWLVRKPIRLDRDDAGRLHNESQMAIEWKDGYGFYYLHGIRFNHDEELFKKIVERKLTFKECLAISNMEQRMMALKYLGADRLLEETNAVLIDHAKGYELYEVKDIFPRTQYFLKYTCPSTGRVYVSGIDPQVGHKKNAIEALKWKFCLEDEPDREKLFDKES